MKLVFACLFVSRCFNHGMQISESDSLYYDHGTDRQIDRVRSVMRRLRAPDGCPWDREQTHLSLLPDLIEETHEFVDAVRSGDCTHMKEELGDVLLQVIFHAAIAEESGIFTLDDVACTLADKLIRRHPHVFAEEVIEHSDDVILRWEEIKKREKEEGITPYLYKTGTGLPAVLRAVKLQKKAGKVKFDWPNSHAVIEKIKEELAEVEETLEYQEGQDRIEEELGDLLFAVTNLCRKEGINPEIAVSKANNKFERRFGKVEARLAHTETPIGTATLEEMDKLWNIIKAEEKETKLSEG